MAFCALSIYGDAVDAVVGTLLTLPSQVSKLCSYVCIGMVDTNATSNRVLKEGAYMYQVAR